MAEEFRTAPTRPPDDSVQWQTIVPIEQVCRDIVDELLRNALRGEIGLPIVRHKGDHQSMDRCLRSPVSYIAIIASRRRSKLVLDYLRSRGFSEEELRKVYAPAGLDLHARTADEIALATLSEIVLLRRGGSSAHRRDVLRETPRIPMVA